MNSEKNHIGKELKEDIEALSRRFDDPKTVRDDLLKFATTVKNPDATKGVISILHGVAHHSESSINPTFILNGLTKIFNGVVMEKDEKDWLNSISKFINVVSVLDPKSMAQSIHGTGEMIEHLSEGGKLNKVDLRLTLQNVTDTYEKLMQAGRNSTISDLAYIVMPIFARTFTDKKKANYAIFSTLDAYRQDLARRKGLTLRK